ncbi:DEAD/DEAH box helicase [Patescibacteria group bacterium]|nr:DEAD/DEAH box helicase [Patescibacteria group bacterium]MBU1124020.1 DEAD/DEAH box helicase [Patescibacteria group bacterium]
MTRLQFGNTWWGEKWLDALIATDYSNRLPRGKRYARNGSVKHLEVVQGHIAAKVRGSRPKPYQVTITIPPLTKKQQQSVLDVINAYPFILSQLQQKKLPEELYQQFTQNNIHLFPQKWSELHAACSCPDWAECCKHIAAVIYLIANRIDTDPFHVFSLRGFDIISALPKSDEQERIDNIHIPRADTMISRAIRKRQKKPVQDTALLSELDFSCVPDLGKSIVGVLPETQLFCKEVNVKSMLHSLYATLMKIRISDPVDDNGYLADALRLETLSIGADLCIRMILHNTDSGDSLLGEDGYDKEIMPYLRRIDFADLQYCEPGIRSLVLIERCASTLCHHGAIIPEVLECAPDRYRIRWLPLMAHPAVRTLVTSLVPWTTCAEYAERDVRKEESQQYCSQELTLQALLSCFIGLNVDEYADKRDIDDPVLYALIGFDEIRLSDTIDRNTVELIWLYFSRFSLQRESNIATLVLTENTSKDFDLSLGMRRKQDDTQVVAMQKLLTQKHYSSCRQDVLHIFGLLSEHYPLISTALMSPDVRVRLSENQCIDLLQHTLPVLTILGIDIQLPKALHHLVRPQVSLSMKKKSNNTIASYLQLQELLQFDWRIALGDAVITKQELDILLQEGRKLVKYKDQFVLLEPEDIHRLLEQMRTSPVLPAARALHTLLSGQLEGVPVQIDNDLLKDMQQLFADTPITVPDGLRATLRPYQERGYNWLYRNLRINFGSVLADDMGLGKTVQVIALLLKMKEEKLLTYDTALVVAPTTLITNWHKEIAKFAPDLRTHIYHGTDRELPKTHEQIDVVLTSYGLLRRDRDTFAERTWTVVVFDEAQNVKNRATAQSKAVKSLTSRLKIALTGTPVENSLMEYWNIVDTVQPGYLGDAKYFKLNFASPIEKERNTQALDTFHTITRPLMMRRMKTDRSIIADLPEKVENDAYTTLTKEQTALYQSVVDEVMTQIEESDGIERKGLVFKLITALKQICNHPAHYKKSSSFNAKESGKMQYLLPLIETLRENHEKALIFTQYTEMGKILQQLLHRETGREPLFFHGGISRKQRDSMIDTFQQDHFHDLMILSLKAGGVGLNLTAANQVFHYDLWWNPAVEAQATDRVYRIGQTKNVLVHRFVTQGTFEEKIDAMIKRKKDLANLTVATGEKWLGELSNEELKDIVTLG